MTVTDSNPERGQVTAAAAEIYDDFFVPALFAPWINPLCTAAGVAPGDRVLDVACGSGAVARIARSLTGPDGAVTGVDINEGMLAVAARRDPAVTWTEGRAEALPFTDASFDRVLCQFGLMFFDDRAAALAEMTRVLRPQGCAAAVVWATPDSGSPYRRLIALYEDLLGPEAADALRKIYVLGDAGELRDLLDSAGIAAARVETLTGQARFPSIGEWMRVGARGWTLADRLEDDVLERLAAAAETALADYAGPDGRVAFRTKAHIISWQA